MINDAVGIKPRRKLSNILRRRRRMLYRTYEYNSYEYVVYVREKYTRVMCIGREGGHFWSFSFFDVASGVGVNREISSVRYV